MHAFNGLRVLTIVTLTAGAYLLLFNLATTGISIEEIVIDLDIVLMVVMLSEHAFALVLGLVWLHIFIFRAHWLIVALVAVVWSYTSNLMAAITLGVGCPLAHFLSLDSGCRSVRFALYELKWEH